MIYTLEVITSIIMVWGKYCVMVHYCASFPNSLFCDVMLVAWNWSQWEYFHHGNWQELQIRDSFPLENWLLNFDQHTTVASPPTDITVIALSAIAGISVVSLTAMWPGWGWRPISIHFLVHILPCPMLACPSLIYRMKTWMWIYEKVASGNIC